MKGDVSCGGADNDTPSRRERGPKKHPGKVGWQKGPPISQRRASVCEMNKSSAQVQKKLRAQGKSAFKSSRIRCLSLSPTSLLTSATDSPMWPLRNGSAGPRNKLRAVRSGK